MAERLRRAAAWLGLVTDDRYADYDERAIYVASGEIDIAGDTFGEGRLLVFKPGDRISLLGQFMGGSVSASETVAAWPTFSDRLSVRERGS